MDRAGTFIVSFDFVAADAFGALIPGIRNRVIGGESGRDYGGDSFPWTRVDTESKGVEARVNLIDENNRPDTRPDATYGKFDARTFPQSNMVVMRLSFVNVDKLPPASRREFVGREGQPGLVLALKKTLEP